MTTNMWAVVIIGAVLLAVLLIEPLRKLAALMVVIIASFALGWYWPKGPRVPLQLMRAGNYPPSCFGLEVRR